VTRRNVKDVFNDKAWLDEFWGDSTYFTGPPLTDEMVRHAERRFGYKFPAGYLRLLRLRNGGSPRREFFHVSGLLGWENYLGIDSLRGIGKHFWRIDTPDSGLYPQIGLIICDTPSGGHDYVMLDYRECGPKGEPRVVHAVQGEGLRGLTVLAPDFAAFVAALSDHPPGEEAED
jgi:hypothetical protein